MPDEQTRRWRKFIDQWVTASGDGICHVIGDTNLDILKWDVPDFINERMVNMVKEEIQTLNFHQVIKGVTRAWPGTEDSHLDQCWSNRPDLILSHSNIVRSVGDHNVIEIVIKMKSTEPEQQESRRRSWKSFNLKRYVQSAAAIQWAEFYKLDNVNVAQHWFQEKLAHILDKAAPWVNIQPRRQYRNWVSNETKAVMSWRDASREAARESRSAKQWQLYKELRNHCNSLTKSDRKSFFREKFEVFERDNDYEKYVRSDEVQGRMESEPNSHQICSRRTDCHGSSGNC